MTTTPTYWTVNCVNGHDYDQSERAGEGGRGPTICGACGSPRIRVTQHLEVFDRRAEPEAQPARSALAGFALNLPPELP